MQFRRALTNLLLLAVSVLLGLGLLEAATRMLFGDKIVLFPRYHTSAHYGEYTYNSRGDWFLDGASAIDDPGLRFMGRQRNFG